MHGSFGPGMRSTWSAEQTDVRKPSRAAALSPSGSPASPPSEPTDASALVNAMLSKDPARRPTAAEVVGWVDAMLARAD